MGWSAASHRLNSTIRIHSHSFPLQELLKHWATWPLLHEHRAKVKPSFLHNSDVMKSGEASLQASVANLPDFFISKLTQVRLPETRHHCALISSLRKKEREQQTQTAQFSTDSLFQSFLYLFILKRGEEEGGLGEEVEMKNSPSGCWRAATFASPI